MDITAFYEQVAKIKMPVRIGIFCGTILFIVGVFIWFGYLPKKEEIKKVDEDAYQQEDRSREDRSPDGHLYLFYLFKKGRSFHSLPILFSIPFYSLTPFSLSPFWGFWLSFFLGVSGTL